MANSKFKRTVSITDSVFEDLRLLTWARRQQGENNASVSALMDGLAREYVAAHKKEVDFLKSEVAAMNKRQAEIFGNVSKD